MNSMQNRHTPTAKVLLQIHESRFPRALKLCLTSNLITEIRLNLSQSND